MTTADTLDHSPTTSLARVLLTLGIAFMLAVLLDARGIVHSGQGMEDGPVRTTTLAVGREALTISAAMRLTWPWDRLQAALGHGLQPSLAPLLASSDPAAPARPPAGNLVGRMRARTASASPTTRGPRRPSVVSYRRRHGHLLRAHVRNAATSTFVPTPRRPLRLLATGDSLMGFIGPQLIDQASHVGPVQGLVDIHNGTGLTRPDFVDWSLVAHQQVAAHHPDAVVVLIGGNDFQNMTLPDGKFFLAGSAAWTREYQRRAAICMRNWSQGGSHRVYWLSMLPARDPSWAYDDGQINIALQHAAAQVPGSKFVNILGPVTLHGRYADFVPDTHGQPILVRQPDGVHLNVAGSDIVANEVLAVIVHDWHLGWPRPSHRHRRHHRLRSR